MATKTLGDFRTLVYDNLARSDTVAIRSVDEAINAAAILAAVLFDPPELRTNVEVALAPGGTSQSLASASFTNPMAITSIYNVTDSEPLWFIPIELWDIIIPTSLTTLKFFSVEGLTIWFKAAPSVATTLKYRYRRYPTWLTNVGDMLDFYYHDEWITATASGLAMATFEEDAMATMWGSVSSTIGTYLLAAANTRGMVQGQKTSLIQHPVVSTIGTTAAKGGA